jgi:hypothetical protein
VAGRAAKRRGKPNRVYPAASSFRCRSNHCIPEKPGLLLVVLGEAEIKGQSKVVYVLSGVDFHHFPFDFFADLTFFNTA